VGLDAHPLTTWSEQREVLLEHLRALQARPQLAGVPIVLAVESNLGFEAAHNARYVSDAGISNVTVAHEQNKRARLQDGSNASASMAEYSLQSVGVRTTQQSKERMYILVRELLEDNAVSVWAHLVARGGGQKQVDKLVKQMHNYSAVHTDAKTAFHSVKRVFTGKAMGEQDDLLIALMIAILYRRVYMQNCTA
jgi:hypothetical protein